MYLTNFSENKVLRAFLGTSVTAPKTMYAACFLSNPGETGGGTEIAYAGYERKPIEFSEPAESDSGVAIQNLQDVNFPASPTNAGRVTYMGLMDSLSGGNMWGYIMLSEPQDVADGIAPIVQAGEWNYVSEGDFSNSFKVKYLNLFRGINLTGFAPFLALYNGNPDTGGAELTGGNYERMSVNFSAPEVQANGQSMIWNTEQVSSNRATEPWGTWTHTAVCNSESSGEVVAFHARALPVTIGRTSAAVLNEKDFSVSLT